MPALDIPETLIVALWAWYAPQEKFAPLDNKSPSFLDANHSRKMLIESEGALERSLSSLHKLKSLRQAASSLLHAIDKRIEGLETSILPITRHHGIRRLPSELMVKIMSMVDDCFINSQDRLEKTMWTFLTVSPFDLHVKYTMSLMDEWRTESKQTLSDVLVRTTAVSRVITKLFLTAENDCSIQDLTDGLRQLRSLKVLEISCQFNYLKIMEGPAPSGAVHLPCLEHLMISNRSQILPRAPMIISGWDRAKPLQWVLGTIDAPNVLRLTSSLVTAEYPQTSLVVLSNVLGFPSRKYPQARAFTFAIDFFYCTAWPFLDFSPIFESLPALSELNIQRCHKVAMKFSSDRGESTGNPVNLRSIRLGYRDVNKLNGPHGLRQSGALLAHLLERKAPLEEVFVDSPDERDWEDAKAVFMRAQWVTDRSILHHRNS